MEILRIHIVIVRITESRWHLLAPIMYIGVGGVHLHNEEGSQVRKIADTRAKT
jgi:hypothetical protein